MPCHRNPPDGDGGPNHWEYWVRDPTVIRWSWPAPTVRQMEVGSLNADRWRIDKFDGQFWLGVYVNLEIMWT